MPNAVRNGKLHALSFTCRTAKIILLGCFMEGAIENGISTPMNSFDLKPADVSEDNDDNRIFRIVR